MSHRSKNSKTHFKAQDVLIEIANQTGWHTKYKSGDSYWSDFEGGMYINFYDVHYSLEFYVLDSEIRLVAINKKNIDKQVFDLYNPKSIEKLTRCFDENAGCTD